MIVLSNDAHNRKPNALPSRERKRALESLRVADEVLVGDADGFAAIVRRVKPAIVVLGYDQKLPDAETEAALAELGAELVNMPWFPGKEERGASSCG